MRRARTLAASSLVLAVFLASCGGETLATVERPEGGFAPEIPAPGVSSAPDDIKIGTFEKPDDAPEYTVIERREIRRDGVKAARLLVDTKADTEAEYRLIARDIKAEYDTYDAVSAEVTDTSSGFDYDGAILVFNTPEGSYYMGFYYSPPSNLGYIVDVAE